MAIRDKRNGETPNAFISHVAAVSWAETQQPERRAAIQSPKKTRFLSISQNNLFSCSLVATNRMWTRFGVQPKKKGYAKPRAPMQNYYGLIVIWLSTIVVPGADHAALSASSFSAHERTLP